MISQSLTAVTSFLPLGHLSKSHRPAPSAHTVPLFQGMPPCPGPSAKWQHPLEGSRQQGPGPMLRGAPARTLCSGEGQKLSPITVLPAQDCMNQTVSRMPACNPQLLGSRSEVRTPESSGGSEVDLKSRSDNRGSRSPTYFSILEAPRVQRDSAVRKHCLDLGLAAAMKEHTPSRHLPPLPQALLPLLPSHPRQGRSQSWIWRTLLGPALPTFTGMTILLRATPFLLPGIKLASPRKLGCSFKHGPP